MRIEMPQAKMERIEPKHIEAMDELAEQLRPICIEFVRKNQKRFSDGKDSEVMMCALGTFAILTVEAIGVILDAAECNEHYSKEAQGELFWELLHHASTEIAKHYSGKHVAPNN